MIKTITMADYGKYKTDPEAPYGLYVPSIKDVRNRNINHLIVYFGSYNGEFRGHQTIRDTKSHGILLRSRPANWYLDPEYALGTTPQEVAGYLSEYIATIPGIKTVTLAGFSMGAFAALLYATWMPRVNVVMASAAQTNFPTHTVVGEIPILHPSMKQYVSIRDVWRHWGPPKNAEIRIQCCEVAKETEDFNDIKDAKELCEFSQVKLKTYECVGHKKLDKPLLADNYNQKFLVR